MNTTRETTLPMSKNSLNIISKTLKEGGMLTGGAFSIDMSLALDQQACGELMNVIARAKERAVD